MATKTMEEKKQQLRLRSAVLQNQVRLQATRDKLKTLRAQLRGTRKRRQTV